MIRAFFDLVKRLFTGDVDDPADLCDVDPYIIDCARKAAFTPPVRPEAEPMGM